MNLNLNTIVVAMLGAFFGGWASSYFNFRIWKRTEKNSFMWEFRLKLHEAEKDMWIKEYPAQLNATLSWLEAAAQDPRIRIKPSIVKEYTELVRAGWSDLNKSKREMDDPEYYGINSDLLIRVREKRDEINNIILSKTKKLKI